MHSGTSEDRVLQMLDAMQADEVTLKQASVILCRAYVTMGTYRKKGHIRAIKKGGQWCVTKAELRRFHLEGNYNPNSPDPADSPQLPNQIKRDAEGGIDLSALTPEERDRLGCSPPQPKSKVY